jgi:hypothetical protein
MKMTVTRHWPEDVAFDGSLIPAHDDSSTSESGWQSVEEMQRELIRRFPHERRFKIENGVSTVPLKFGIVYTVTLSE